MSSEAKTYVMYGYHLQNEDDTAYFGERNKIVTEIEAARRFYSRPRKRQKGFGSPQQWLDFINSDPDLNQGYKFHLVSVLL